MWFRSCCSALLVDDCNVHQVGLFDTRPTTAVGKVMEPWILPFDNGSLLETRNGAILGIGCNPFDIASTILARKHSPHHAAFIQHGTDLQHTTRYGSTTVRFHLFPRERQGFGFLVDGYTFLFVCLPGRLLTFLGTIVKSFASRTTHEFDCATLMTIGTSELVGPIGLGGAATRS